MVNNVDIRIDSLETHNRFIHCLIHDGNKDHSWMATFVYGYSKHHLQKYLWKEITNLNSCSNKSWMIVGGLNELTGFQKIFANTKGNSTQYDK